MSQFYNPGFAWKDTLKYDNPVGDPREVNLISYHVVEAPEDGFFEVKDTTTMKLPTGEEYDVPLRFRELIRHQYAERGVVLISPGRECNETENIAPNKEEAKRKGKAIWKEFTRSKCNEWFGIVEEVKAAGRLPAPAQGLFKRCLQECGIPDPADVASGLANAREGQRENKDLQAQIAALTAQVNQLIGANKGK